MTLVEILDSPRGGSRGSGRGGGERELGSACCVGVELEAAIDRFAKELGDCVDAELGDALRRTATLRSMLDAVEVAVVGRFDRSHEWSVDGYRHPTSWVKTECRLPRGVAGKKVGLARSLREMPRTAAAFASGQIDIAHVDRLASANTPQRAEAFAAAEAVLVLSAREDSFEDFVRAVDYFEHHVDPDPDGTEADRDAKRRAHSSKMFNGMGKVDAVLDPVGWSLFDTVLRKIDKELFDADWASVVAEHGDAASLAMLGRTARQRRADALVEMARRAAATPAGVTSPKPLVIVHIDAATLEAELKRRVGAAFEYPTQRLCELQNGAVITPGQAAALAIEGHIRRMVFDDDGVCVDYGRKQRLYTGALREMIEHRDRRCTGPGCDVPWWDCDIDHIIDWQHQGHTNATNGDLKCRWHNQHKPHYTITTDPTTGRTHWHKRDP